MRVRKVGKPEIGQVLLLAEKIFPKSRVEAREGDVFFIAEKKGIIVGFVHVRERKGGFEIAGLGVEKAYRGAGVGSGLLDAAVAYCKGKGARKIVLAVSESNIAATRVYAKHGFSATKRKGADVLMRAAEPN